MNRIKPEHSISDAIYAISNGNPGAVTTIMEVYKHLGEHAMLRFMITLDSKGIYGSKIWYAYKYCHNFNAKDTYEWITDQWKK